MTEFNFENHVVKSLDNIQLKIDDLCDRTTKIETKLEIKLEDKKAIKDDKKTIITLGVAILAVVISFYKAIFG